MYRFLFIDDEDYLRASFVSMLDWARFGFAFEASFDSASAALTYLKKAGSLPHVVISDIRTGEMMGTELAEKLKRLFPEITVVLISGYKDFDYALSAIRANVFDYILKPFSRAQIENLFERLKQHIDLNMSSSANAHGPESFEDAASAAIKYMRENYQANLTLEEIARHVCMNPAYFSRYFKKETGLNFSDYLTDLRMERAKQFLAQPQMKVYQICEKVGYKNLQHFYCLFKQHTGMTPTEYKKARQEVRS